MDQPILTTQLYLISPDRVDDRPWFYNALSGILATGKIAAFQLRLKEMDEKDVLEIAQEVVVLCRTYMVPCVINDNPEIARTVRADGVHVGLDDMPYEEVRRIVGDDATIGVSCYDSIDRAMMLGEKGADYVAFGAFFPTTSKAARATPDLDLIEQWVSISAVPCVAIGGINEDNIGLVAEKGADFAAMISAVWKAKDSPVAAVERLAAAVEIDKKG